MAPLSKDAGGYGLCKKGSNKTPVFSSKSDKDYLTILKAVENSSDYLNTIKRFDMDGFVVRPDYYREMKRYGVIGADVTIEEVDPYVVDSIYWGM
jgi:hypothetical protein